MGGKMKIKENLITCDHGLICKCFSLIINDHISHVLLFGSVENLNEQTRILK